LAAAVDTRWKIAFSWSRRSLTITVSARSSTNTSVTPTARAPFTTSNLFGVMAVIQVRVAVKRRAAGIGSTEGKVGDDDPRSLRYASKIATQRLLEAATSENHATPTPI
jgi:hypothetical protein